MLFFVAFADEIDKSARKLGVSVEKFQLLGFAAKQNGVSVEQLINSTNRLSRTLAKSDTASEATKKAFQSLGLSMEELKDKTPDQQLEEVFAAVSKIEDPTKRAGASFAVFGTGAKEIIPLMEGSKEIFEDAAKGLKEIGGAISAKDVDNVSGLGDAFSKTWTAIKSLGVEVLSAMSTAIKNLLDSVNSSIKTLRDLHKGYQAIRGVPKVADKAGKIIGKDFSMWGNLKKNYGDLFGDIFGTSTKKQTQLGRGNLLQTDALNKKMGSMHGSQFEADFHKTFSAPKVTGQGKQSFGIDLSEEFKRNSDILKQQKNQGIESLKQSTQHAKDVVHQQFEQFTGDVRQTASHNKQRLHQEFGQFMEQGKKQALLYQEAARERANSMAETMKSINRAVSSSLTDFISSILKGSTSLKSALNSLLSSLGGKLLDFGASKIASGLLGLIPGGSILSGIAGFFGFADGGSFKGGKPIMVGEKGPELILPSRGGTVIPNHMLGGGGMNITMNIMTKDAQSFRRSQGQIMAEFGQALRDSQRNM